MFDVATNESVEKRDASRFYKLQCKIQTNSGKYTVAQAVRITRCIAFLPAYIPPVGDQVTGMA